MYFLSKASAQTETPYPMSGSIDPLYIISSTLMSKPYLFFAKLNNDGIRNNDLSDDNNTTAILNTKLEEISTQNQLILKHFKTNFVSKSYSSAVKMVSNRSADVLHDNKQT